MEKQQEGIVIETRGDMARVKTSRHNDCENCGACPGNSAIVLDARNPLDAKIGQRVVIEIQEVNMLKAAFIVYVLPLLAAFAGDDRWLVGCQDGVRGYMVSISGWIYFFCICSLLYQSL
ncbi:MAG: positive regulator of sigma RseC/MucC [Firmicutes bacterium]|nr:positive regulator of sigma RseC/MucC [Bacillota bacterium]